MECIRGILEIIYYIAFIILTYILVLYAKKTYLLEANRSFELLCEFAIRQETLGKSTFGYALEIYNAGNVVAKNVDVFINGNKITRVNFIKPNDSYYFPLGYFGVMLDGNMSLSGLVEPKKGEDMEVILRVDKEEINCQLNTDILFSISGINTGTLKDIENALNKIERKLQKK